MNRALTLLAATVCAALTVSSACFAADWSSVDFRLGRTGGTDKAQLIMASRQVGNRHFLAAPGATSFRFALI